MGTEEHTPPHELAELERLLAIIVLICGGLALLSSFLPWSTFGPQSRSAFEEAGYGIFALFLGFAAMMSSLVVLVTGKDGSNIKGLALGAMVIGFLLGFLAVTGFKDAANQAIGVHVGAGVWTLGLAALGMVGVAGYALQERA